MGEDTGKLAEQTVEKWIEDITTSKKPSPFFLFMLLGAALSWSSSGTTVFIAAVQGVDPEPGDWICHTERCGNVTVNTTEQLCESIFDKKELTWDDIILKPKRKTYTTDFKLFCKQDTHGQTRLSILHGILFIGGIFGLVAGAYVYDNIGRKRPIIFGNCANLMCLFFGIFCTNYWMLLVLRFIQGLGDILAATAVFVWAMELLPSPYRPLMTGFYFCIWTTGYGMVAAFGYLIHNWHYQYLACTLYSIVMYVPMIFIVESPRFYILKNDTENARLAIQRIAKMNGITYELEEVRVATLPQDRSQSLLQQLRELIKYPTLSMETLILLELWFYVGIAYFGFNFCWSRLVPDIYIGYLLAFGGECFTYILSIYLARKSGRRRMMLAAQMVTTVCLVLSMFNVEIGNGWTLESLCSIVGVLALAITRSLSFLYTGELAPTSHRGMVYAICSVSGRVGSSVSPFVFNNLYYMAHKSVALGILFFLGVVGIVGTLFLVETADRTIPEVPQDVRERRKFHTFRI